MKMYYNQRDARIILKQCHSQGTDSIITMITVEVFNKCEILTSDVNKMSKNKITLSNVNITKNVICGVTREGRLVIKP